MKIVIYPYFNNPYQDLLYSRLQKDSKLEYNYFDNAAYKKHVSIGILLAPCRLILYRFKGYKIFHLHWQEFEVPAPISIIRLFLSSIYAILFILCVKILGFKLVWTIHNVKPHDRKFLYDLLISKYISKLSDAKIVHSKYIISELKENKINTSNIYVIPHGNYIDTYKNNITGKDARKKFSIPEDSFVFLFLGLMRKYKGIDNLLNAFEKIADKHSNARLVIAGKCYDDEIKESLEVHKSKLSGKLIIKLEHIEDSDVQYYMNAADVVVLPYKHVTTSGSALLAMSFKKPIIYPRIGSLQDFPDNVGTSYKAVDKNGLANAMNQVLSKKDILKRQGESGYAYANSFTWEQMADQTMEVYRFVLGK